jgi:hypothetical protein
MNIHPDFKNKKILQYVADLIINYGYEHYSDLSDADKEGLTALLIEANPYETDSIIDSHVVAYFCKSLNGTADDNENFLQIIKAKSVDYYEKTMELLFEYVNDDYESQRNEWLDFAAKHGDSDQAYDQYRDSL